jgi:serine/threonine-protein kinase
MYKSIRCFALGGSAVAASVLALAVTSVAAKTVETYKNVVTGLCLHSNASRDIYTQSCNSGSYQKWLVTLVGSNRTLKNVATGLCLESNASRDIYTQSCNGSSYQKWTAIRGGSYITLKNVVSGLCLESNASRDVYMQSLLQSEGLGSRLW